MRKEIRKQAQKERLGNIFETIIFSLILIIWCFFLLFLPILTIYAFFQKEWLSGIMTLGYTVLYWSFTIEIVK